MSCGKDSSFIINQFNSELGYFALNSGTLNFIFFLSSSLLLYLKGMSNVYVIVTMTLQYKYGLCKVAGN